uniref:Putative ovule protein n=1 Tax=Solanum chacoense TaxID=4108 RepID=A0A0V0H1K6_SOLCH
MIVLFVWMKLRKNKWQELYRVVIMVSILNVLILGWPNILFVLFVEVNLRQSCLILPMKTILANGD